MWQRWSQMSPYELLRYTSLYTFPLVTFTTPAPPGCEKLAEHDGLVDPELCKQFFTAHPDLAKQYGYEA